MINKIEEYSNFSRKIINCYVFNVVVAISLYVISGSSVPTGHPMFFQLFFLFQSVIMLYAVNRVKASQIWIFYLFITLVSVLTLRGYYLDYADTPFGFMHADAKSDGVSYDKFATYAITDSSKTPTVENLRTHNSAAKIDDLFYYTYSFYIYKFLGDVEAARAFIICLNSLIFTIGIRYAYKAYQRFCKFPDNRAIFFITMIGSYIVVNITRGTKESVFMTAVTMAIYYLVGYSDKRNTKSLIGFFVFTTVTLFFRMLIPAFLIVSFVYVLLDCDRWRKFMPGLTIIGAACVLISVPVMLVIIGLNDMSMVVAIAKSRAGGSLATVPINAISSIIGPFPKYIVSEPNRIEPMYAAALFIKMCFSFYFLAGVWHIIRYRVYKYWYLVVYILLNILMVAISGVALDIRYHITYFIPYIFILMYGYNLYAKKYRFMKSIYFIGVIGLIIVYNIVSL